MAAYDYLIVGSGLFGAVFAHQARKAGKRVLVVEKRRHIAGNVYTQVQNGITVHRYGAHIFHTDDEAVWRFVTQFDAFDPFINAPLARYGDRLYHLPFNMNTFNAMWGVATAQEAQEIIARQRQEIKGEPQNLEEQAIALVGRDIYEALVKGYTEKQWGRPCRELPPFIIKRLPVRFTYDNHYFNDRFQGIPQKGYTALVAAMLEGVEVKLNTTFLGDGDPMGDLADRVLFTGPIDQYFGYRLGSLEYRSLRFETEDLPIANYQGNAVVNYTAADVPFTRIIEHKHFAWGHPEVLTLPHTVVTREYPKAWTSIDEPYYPVNQGGNITLYQKYAELAARTPRVIFGGRLGQYRYLDMDDTIRAALDLAERELSK